MPGQEIEISLWITNTSAAAITGIVIAVPFDPEVQPYAVSAMQGAVEVQDHTLLANLGTLERGQTSLIVARVHVRPEAPPGKVILHQATAFHASGRTVSNISEVGLPPNELPATGHDWRGP
jgi:hypothetical protein